MSPQKKKPTERPDTEPTGGAQRLQRVMAAAGIGSRRECELIIQEGRVEVDGQIVAMLGVKVDPATQKIFVDGERVVAEKLQYFMLNKPPGVISTSNDPAGRARVIDLIRTDQRVYNVGRLDQSSEGLILVTNDGDLANQLTHPRFGIEKKYHVQVAGVPTAEQLRALEEGVYIAEGKAKATSAKFLRTVKSSSWIEIILAEGKNREIRRMLAGIGHKVRTLKRVAIGPLKLGDLPVGAHRELTPAELKMLKRAAAGLQTGPTKKKKPNPTKKKTSSFKRSESSSKSATKFGGAGGATSSRKKTAGRTGAGPKSKPDAKSKRPAATRSGQRKPKRK